MEWLRHWFKAKFSGYCTKHFHSLAKSKTATQNKRQSQDYCTWNLAVSRNALHLRDNSKNFLGLLTLTVVNSTMENKKANGIGGKKKQQTWYIKSYTRSTFFLPQMKLIPCKQQPPQSAKEPIGNQSSAHQRLPLHQKERQSFALFWVNPSHFPAAICCLFGLTVMKPSLPSPNTHREWSEFPSLLTAADWWVPKGCFRKSPIKTAVHM